MAERRYRIHKWDSRRWGPANPENRFLNIVTSELKTFNGPYVHKPRGRPFSRSRNWSPELSLRETRKAIDRLYTPRTEPGTTYFVKPVGKPNKFITVVTSELWFADARLPSGSNLWPKALRDIYQFIYAKGRYPEYVSYLGVYNCRLTRQGGSYSYHSWYQALDAGITRPSGAQDRNLALQMERDVTEEFGKDLMYVITWKDDPQYHYNHNHNQVKPDRSGMTPPCAR